MTDDSETEVEEKPSQPKPLLPPWFIMTIASVLLVMFVVSYTVDMLSTSYEVPASIYGIILIVVGFIFGGQALKGLRS